MKQRRGDRLDEFAKLTKEAAEPSTPTATRTRPRSAPHHPRAPDHDLEGLQTKDIEDTVAAIMSMRSTSARPPTTAQQGGLRGVLPGLRGHGTQARSTAAPARACATAFGEACSRANAMKSYKDKAWALRDTFDGMIRVRRRWCTGTRRSVRARSRRPCRRSRDRPLSLRHRRHAAPRPGLGRGAFDAIIREHHGVANASEGIRYGGKTDPGDRRENFAARMGRSRR